MKKTLKVYVLHMKKLEARISRIMELLCRCYFVEDIEVITSENSDLKFSALAEKRKCLPQDFDVREFTTSEKSLYQKHFRAMKKISNDSQPAMILEDDVIFEPKNLDIFVQQYFKFAERHDCVFFGTGCGLRLQGAGFIKNENRLKSKCTDSFIITPEASRVFVENMTTEGAHTAIDWEMNYIFLKYNMDVYWYEPGVVYQGSQTGLYSSEIKQK
jgi:GR25 family glycosyltransferase involved in LPS biosynthesis